LALGGDEWSVSRLGRFTSVESALGTHWVRVRVGRSVVSSSEPRFLGRTARSLVTISTALRQLLLAASLQNNAICVSLRELPENFRVLKTSTPFRSEVTAHIGVVVDTAASGPVSNLIPNIGCPNLGVGDFPVPRMT
jgi:hypothetical protein